jgi:hypothetical protein
VNSNRIKGIIQITTLIIMNLIMIVFLIYVLFDPKVATWLSLFGSFCALIGGALTLVGVRITIKDAEKVRRQNEYPKKIDNLEELVRKLDYNIEKLETHTWLKEPFDTSPYIDLRLHFVDQNLLIQPTEEHKLLIDDFFIDIKQNVLAIDAVWYKDFFELRNKVRGNIVNFTSEDYGLNTIWENAQEYFMENFDPMMSWRDYAEKIEREQYEKACIKIAHNEFQLIHSLLSILREYQNMAEIAQLNMLYMIKN